ncbi:MAG: response regulator [Aliifodinibius sp.]|nr:response regulator [Fodinibius sp.]NIY27715.1 response regulator [Fodinibius sp.]
MNKGTILVATDDLKLSECIADIIDEDQFCPIYLNRASEVLLRILDLRLDLLILDIDLSGMSGLEIIPIIKKIRPSVPLIVVSSDNTFETGQKVAKYGIWSFLLKPIDTDKLECFLNFVKPKA